MTAARSARLYRVTGYHTGDFIGRVLFPTERYMVRVEIVDTLRPAPKIPNRCPFPRCVDHDFHGGEHQFETLRQGAVIEIPWQSAKFVLLEEAA